jgi:hypothetical protein
MDEHLEIICSYLKMNNKDDEFKSLFNYPTFIITQNNYKIFEFRRFHCNDYYMIFYMKSVIINRKRFYKNGKKMYYIETKKLEKDYLRRYKKIYYSNIELNKYSIIQYSFKKKYLLFMGYINTIKNINYLIYIRYRKRLIYKFRDGPFNISFKYTNCKILSPNKYELLYYSNYFLIIS